MINYIIIAGIAVAVIYLVLRPILKRRHREEVRAEPFPKDWVKIMDKNLPVYKYLSEDLQVQLQKRVQVFIDEKSFHGFEGVEINDEVKVTIASQACLLLLNRDIDNYPELYTINVYPSAYVAKEIVHDASGAEREVDSVRLGESWTHGSIVLAWDHSKGDARNFHDGHNVVIHEFSHQLDQLSGAADGAPVLENRSSYKSWGVILSHDYLELREHTLKHQKDIIDDYGATDPAEFFAVATETFFEQPTQLSRKHPELFKELMGYYKVDPRTWTKSNKTK